MSIFRAKRIDITEEGLAKILGSLESVVLEYLWEQPNMTARQVCDHLNAQRTLSFNAVNTVLTRLTHKGIVKKKKNDGSFIYSARYSREHLQRSVAHDVFRSLLRDRGLFGIAAFTEAVEQLTTAEKNDLRNALDTIHD